MPKRVSWKDKLRANPIPWLLEADASQPAIRYFTLRDIAGRSESDTVVREARAAIMRTGPVPAILAAQAADAHWSKPGPGYSPKYRSTVWQVIFLAQLGADAADAKVQTGCEYLLSHAIATHGGFSVNGTPSGFNHCLAGNLEAALIDLDRLQDARVQSALEMQARYITGAGVADARAEHTAERYYRITPGPLFACGRNGGLPCAWGAIKALAALGKVPEKRRSKTMVRAIRQGTEFLLSHDPAIADYPHGSGDMPSSSWFKFGYPLGYVADVLQNLEVLAALGQAQEPRLAHALEMVTGKQDAQGRWRLEYSYQGKMWADIEKKGKPSKWITLRALRVLKAAYPD